MILKLHHTSLTELQQLLLAAYIFLMLIDEEQAEEVYGEQFDKLFKYE